MKSAKEEECDQSFGFLVLLISLIREKNAQVKEILKVLSLSPIFNNIAQAIRYDLFILIVFSLACLSWNVDHRHIFDSAAWLGVLIPTKIERLFQHYPFRPFISQLLRSQS